jgi:divalent metal cation (Fe/Co/Zn/Cd) transporter
MSSAPQITKQDTFRRIQGIQTVTILWMAIEAAVSLSAAWLARSPALLAFGGDSAIELISAVVVLRRFQVPEAHEEGESRAARIAGFLLFALAAYVVIASAVTLFGHTEPKRSYLGVAVLIGAAIFMPWLAKEKRRLSAVTGSAALRADAAESALCGYLSMIALLRLVVNAVWHVEWADPVAALCLVPFIVREGWEAVQSEAVEC